jgi:hypothetical protein
MEVKMEIFDKDKLFDFVSFGGETGSSIEDQEKLRKEYERLDAEYKKRRAYETPETVTVNPDITYNPEDFLVKGVKTVSDVLAEEKDAELPDICPSCGKRHFQVLSSTPINDDFLVFNEDHWEKYTPDTKQYRVKCLECGAIYDLVI